MLEKRKAQKELQLIISLVILLVVAVVVISLFMEVFSTKPDPASGELERQEVIRNCNRLCNNIKQAKDLPNQRSAIFNYCKETYSFDASSGEGSLTENVYVPSSGHLAFCKDNARCFNFQEGMCTVDGVDIGPEVCRDILCMRLTSQGLSQSEAEDRIQNDIMVPGDCELTKEAHPETIYVETWWEQYYQDVDCSGNSSDDSGNGNGGSSGGDCDEVCGSSGATENSCVDEQQCSTLRDLGQAGDMKEADCPSGEVCCCAQ